MKVTDTVSLGEMIRKRRKTQGYTQKELTELTGISSSFLSDLENGKKTVETGKVIEILHILGMDIDVSERV